MNKVTNCKEILIWLECSSTTGKTNSVHGKIIFNFPGVITLCMHFFETSNTYVQVYIRQRVEYDITQETVYQFLKG